MEKLAATPKSIDNPGMYMVSPSLRWFIRLWSVAIIAHLVGDPRAAQVWPDANALGVSALALGVIAVALLIVPSSRPLLAASGVGVMLVAWFEAPFLSNHWVLACAVAAALLVAVTRPDPWAWFAPTGRWILLGFYSWAAFNKLNAGFFDPSVSCGPVYANEWLSSAGLPSISMGSALAMVVAVLTAVTELSIPLLLVIKRTRRVGVLVGFAFHGLISLDLGQHFYDFTSVLLALFTLFLADSASAALEDGLTASRRHQIEVAAFPLLLVVASLLPLGSGLINAMALLVWAPYLLWVTIRTVRASRIGEDAPASLRLRQPVMVLIVALVLANGLTPYLELKTGYGWNMYANLATANGESNHFLIRATMPLTDVQRDLAVVLDSNDEALEQYDEFGYGVPERQLLHYLSSHPETSVTYSVGAQLVEGTGSELGRRLPVLIEKFQLFRAVDLEDPARCQTTWLEAG